MNTVLKELQDRDILVWLDLIAYDKVVSTNLVTLVKPKHMTLLKPEIKYEIKQLNEKKFIVAVNSKFPALWCWLELENTLTKISDNFFHLREDKKYSITISLDSILTLVEFEKKLIIRSLYNTY